VALHEDSWISTRGHSGGPVIPHPCSSDVIPRKNFRIPPMHQEYLKGAQRREGRARASSGIRRGHPNPCFWARCGFVFSKRNFRSEAWPQAPDPVENWPPHLLLRPASPWPWPWPLSAQRPRAWPVAVAVACGLWPVARRGPWPWGPWAGARGPVARGRWPVWRLASGVWPLPPAPPPRRDSHITGPPSERRGRPGARHSAS
jgi:hypothetical protein